MGPFLQSFLLGASLLACSGLCLEVTPGSSCATFCLDPGFKDGFNSKASSTNTTDIVCEDGDFGAKDIGIKFKGCLECLQKSEKVNETESDLHWYLYNMRYAVSTCLFSLPNQLPGYSGDSPCILEHACRPLKTSLTADGLKPDEETYGYCSADGSSFDKSHVEPCIKCLQASTDQKYISNFVTALQAGCQQRPDPGALVSLSGTVFTTSAVNITEPAVDIRTKPEGAGSGTMTTGTIVGIAVGAGLLLIGGVALFIVYWRRQKKFDRDEQMSALRTYGSTPDPFLPPPGGKMSASLRSYSEQGYHGDGHYMSSGDYYDKMEDELRSGKLNYNYDPRSTSRGPNSALPAHQAYIPQAMSRGNMNTHTQFSGHNPPQAAFTHRHTGSNASDSYIMGSVQPPAPTHQNDQRRGATSVPPPPPPPGGPASQRKIPSLVLPTVSKLRMPKKYSPPMVIVHDAEPVGDAPRRELQISQPVIPSSARFQDTPLPGGVVYATDAKAVEQVRHNFDNYGDVPMRSGNSLLYG